MYILINRFLIFLYTSVAVIKSSTCFSRELTLLPRVITFNSVEASITSVEKCFVSVLVSLYLTFAIVDKRLLKQRAR